MKIRKEEYELTNAERENIRDDIIGKVGFGNTDVRNEQQDIEKRREENAVVEKTDKLNLYIENLNRDYPKLVKVSKDIELVKVQLDTLTNEDNRPGLEFALSSLATKKTELEAAMHSVINYLVVQNVKYQIEDGDLDYDPENAQYTGTSVEQQMNSKITNIIEKGTSNLKRSLEVIRDLTVKMGPLAIEIQEKFGIDMTDLEAVANSEAHFQNMADNSKQNTGIHDPYADNSAAYDPYDIPTHVALDLGEITREFEEYKSVYLENAQQLEKAREVKQKYTASNTKGQ